MSKRLRRSQQITLLLTPVLLAGCGDGIEEAQQRDVYTKFEDCMADWGQQELCQQLGQADAAQFKEEVTGVGGGSGGGTSILFWGPSYFPSDRSVSYRGATITPYNNRAMSRPYRLSERSSPAARKSAATPSPSRGGFGSTGRGFSAGG